jgi:ubiquinone/menaquinone biosynthesis C-methylase UbiE
MSNLAERYWKTEANIFDSFYDPPPQLLHRFVHHFLLERFNLIARLSEDIRPGQLVADIGCGSGLYIGLALNRGANSIGVDYSSQMLKLTRARLKEFDPTLYHLKEGDSHRLPLKDDACDWVLAVGLLDYVEDLDTVLTELHRVLKSGGQVIMTFPKSPSPFFLIRSSFGNTIRRALLGLPPIKNILNEQQLVQVVTKTGFTIQHLTAIQATMWVVKAIRS